MSGLFRDNRMGAVFSEDREYRYRLWRTLDVEKPTLAFLMLNPSTADETADDPTIRRCIGFAESWGYGTLIVGNLFALRATEPKELYEHPEPIGPENNDHLRQICEDAEAVVAAWGAHGDYQQRGWAVTRMLDVDLLALGTTMADQPVHPLFQPADAEPIEFTEAIEDGGSE